MELQVQKYLRAGGTLDRLKEDLGVSSRVNEALGVVCLNYSQILSPMGHPIVQECRQLILSLEDWSVVSWTLPKFFNVGEGHISKDFNWNSFKTYEKLDGSLIAVYFWRGAWSLATRSVPGADTDLDDTGLTFKGLVLMALRDMGTTFDEFCSYLDPKFCFALELTTPENQVVVEYPERRLTLLAVRDTQTLLEFDPHEWAGQSRFPFPIVTLYPGWSLEAVKQEVQGRNPKQHEGFVLVDQHFNRAKVKSEAYCFMSSRKDSLQKSNKARIELILADAADDVMPSLPAYLQGKILDLQAKITTLVRSIDTMYQEVKDIEGDKDFALRVQQSGLSAPMFAIRKGKAKDGLDFLKRATPRRVLEYINEADTEDDDEVS